MKLVQNILIWDESNFSMLNHSF